MCWCDAPEACEPVAEQLAGLLGWTSEQTSEQISLLERQQETDLTFI
jgi:hypothetical protein